MCSLGHSGICSGEQAGLEFRDYSPDNVSQLLGLRVCTTIIQQENLF